ncbi:MAG TPA: sulfate adenylyltransferase subunit CysD [Polyangia bacterium]|nr:sulfate adenylyltransferase subunit CysD [Polyangia bacterium]
MDHLDQLEQQSVYILREAFRHFERLCMLWSIGKDSTVMLWLARKAFFGHVPFPLVHVDTSYKLPEMIAYRDKLAFEYKLQMIVGQNKQALEEGDTFPIKLGKNPSMGKEEQQQLRTACCGRLKSDALGATLHGTGTRRRMNLATGAYEVDPDREPYTGVIVGARADEEGSRSKERYFSPRDKNDNWDVGDQPPEFWNQFKTDFAPGTHVRVHPLLDWTELNIWEYIKREQIPTVSLYYDQGSGTRYRSLGCGPCQSPIKSASKNVDDIITELKSGALKNVAERSGRLQDGKHGLEELRRKGYM